MGIAKKSVFVFYFVFGYACMVFIFSHVFIVRDSKHLLFFFSLVRMNNLHFIYCISFIAGMDVLLFPLLFWNPVSSCMLCAALVSFHIFPHG